MMVLVRLEHLRRVFGSKTPLRVFEVRDKRTVLEVLGFVGINEWCNICRLDVYCGGFG
jgi:hypothetical protein